MADDTYDNRTVIIFPLFMINSKRRTTTT